MPSLSSPKSGGILPAFLSLCLDCLQVFVVEATGTELYQAARDVANRLADEGRGAHYVMVFLVEGILDELPPIRTGDGDIVNATFTVGTMVRPSFLRRYSPENAVQAAFLLDALWVAAYANATEANTRATLQMGRPLASLAANVAFEGHTGTVQLIENQPELYQRYNQTFWLHEFRVDQLDRRLPLGFIGGVPFQQNVSETLDFLALPDGIGLYLDFLLLDDGSDDSVGQAYDIAVASSNRYFGVCGGCDWTTPVLAWPDCRAVSQDPVP